MRTPCCPPSLPLFVSPSLKERSLLSASKEESVWVHHEMGKCYLELKEFDLAKEVGERAVSLASEVKDMTWYLNSSVLVAQAEGMYIRIMLIVRPVRT